MILRRKKKHDAEVDARIEEASEKVRELVERSEKVVPPLMARHGRNHWGQTVAEIARGER